MASTKNEREFETLTKFVKEVMRYSGMYCVKRGRVDWLVKYFMT